jgi:2'-5' RNA ligase
MYGIASLLPQPYYQQVEDLWDCLEHSFGFSSVRITPYPHITWVVADEEPAGLDKRLAKLAELTPPLVLQTHGVGFFVGPEPVVYIHVEKSPPLVAFHAEICRLIIGMGGTPARLYNTPDWVPHITLIIQDLSETRLNVVLEMLEQLPLTWEMSLESLVLGRASSNEAFQLNESYPFAAPPGSN